MGAPGSARPRARGSCHQWSRSCPFARGAHRLRLVSLDKSLDIVSIEQVIDADLAQRLELQDDLDARQVDPLASGEKADDTHPPDIGLRVEPEVVAPMRADQPLLFVDAQRAWVHLRQLGGDAE